jgi:flagellar hook assembly protein FlgD
MPTIAQATNRFVPGDIGAQYTSADEEKNGAFPDEMKKETAEIEPMGAPNSLQKLFTDPEKMLKLWLIGETKPNPFAQEQKDPMDSFGKFMQAMLMQTQTSALTNLEETMERSNRYTAAGLIGEMVDIETDKMTIASGRKTIENFTVSEEVDAFSVEIKNAEGEIVYQNMVYNPGAGINQFAWPGIDNEGKEVPLGEYRVSISLLKKVVEEGAPPRFELLEHARSLDGAEIHDKVETLSMTDRDVQFSYEIPEGLSELTYASVWITDSKGHAVHKGELEVKSGDKGVYSWNCLDAAGKRVPEDTYTVQFNLKNGNRKMIATDKSTIVRVSGKVQGIEVNESGETNLVTSRIKAPLSAVKRIVSENGL